MQGSFQNLEIKGFAAVDPDNYIKMGSKFSFMFFSGSDRANEYATVRGRKLFPCTVSIAADPNQVPPQGQKVITKNDLIEAWSKVSGEMNDDDMSCLEKMWAEL